MSAFKSSRTISQNADVDPLANFRGGKKIDPDSDEAGFVKFQYILGINGAYEVSNFEVWKLENLDNSLQFEKKMKSLLKVASWIRTSSLTHENNIENLSKRGFVFPQQDGMTFPTGNIDLVMNSSSQEIVYVFCDVAVGKALIVEKEDISKDIPEGYDSFYIPGKPLDRNKDGEFSLGEYQAAASFDGRLPS
jgi:hypothetical protein